jgi:hypothetical protein
MAAKQNVAIAGVPDMFLTAVDTTDTTIHFRNAKGVRVKDTRCKEGGVAADAAFALACPPPGTFVLPAKQSAVPPSRRFTGNPFDDPLAGVGELLIERQMRQLDTFRDTRVKQFYQKHPGLRKKQPQLCRYFMRGLCQKNALMCMAKHTMGSNTRIANCQFFASNRCMRSDCEFLHDRSMVRAKQCPDYLLGFCARGPACSLHHFRRAEVPPFAVFSEKMLLQQSLYPVLCDAVRSVPSGQFEK